MDFRLAFFAGAFLTLAFFPAAFLGLAFFFKDADTLALDFGPFPDSAFFVFPEKMFSQPATNFLVAPVCSTVTAIRLSI